MAFDSLGEFITVLEDAGEILRISSPVDPVLEIAALTQEISTHARESGPVLLFSSPRGSSWPIVTNLLGHPRRILRALNVDSLENLPLISDRMSTKTDPSLLGKRSPLAPRTVRQGICQQVIKLGRDVDLRSFPFLRCWPDEPYPGITGAVFIGPHLNTGGPALSWHSAQVIDRQRILPHWTTVDRLRAAAIAAQKSRQQLPVALIFGGDPVLGLAADAAHWLDGSSSYEFAGILRQKPLDVLRCRSHDLEVPADAELILEGFIDPDAEWETLESQGLPHGHYSEALTVPVIQVTAITHRANPLLTAQIVQPSPSEATWRQGGIDRLFFPQLQSNIPGLREFHRPDWGQGSVAVVSINKQSPRDAWTVSHALWGNRGLRLLKWIYVVDADVNVFHDAQVFAAVSQHVDPAKDHLMAEGPVSPSDFATSQRGMGVRIAIDATRKTAEEGYVRQWPRPLEFPRELIQRLHDQWEDWKIPEMWRKPL